MANEAGFTIIIPCYKAGAYVKEAVESIYALPIRRPFEVIIVDDSSPDQLTIDSIEQIRGKFPELKIVRNKSNLGVSESRNIGISLSKYDYIIPFDADDKWNTDSEVLKKGTYFDRAVDILEQDEDVYTVYCALRDFGDIEGVHVQKPHTEESLLHRNNIPCYCAYRKKEAILSGGYDSDVPVEDWAFNVQLLDYRLRNNLGRKVVKFEEPYYMYRRYIDGDNRSASSFSKSEQIARMYSRNPSIFKYCYPHISQDNMVEYLANKNVLNISEKFSIVVNNPAWTLEKINNKIKKNINQIFSLFNRLTNEEETDKKNTISSTPNLRR